jgi:8-amino-7-oxononanoate synthase
MKEPDFHIKALSDRQTNGQLRKLEGDPIASFDFFSNDYLGFVHDAIIMPKDSGLRSGATGSRLLSGDSSRALLLEQYLADYHHMDAALLFQSGYMANLGLLSCVAKRGDTIIYDNLVHASLRQAVQLSPVSTYSFKHNDIADLKAKLNRSKGTVFVVVEALYSMDGDEGVLEDICSVCSAFGAYLIVDEAHSTGVYGAKGRGLVDQLHLKEAVWARVHTFGKAAGVHGAAVLGSKHLIDFLINFSKPFIYTTALSDHSLDAIHTAYKMMQSDHARQQLWGKVRYFEDCLSKAGLEEQFYSSNSPIKCLKVDGAAESLRISKEIRKAGYMVKAIRYPTVPKGTDRIRLCIHKHNTEDQIKGIIELIRNQVR